MPVIPVSNGGTGGNASLGLTGPFQDYFNLSQCFNEDIPKGIEQIESEINDITKGIYDNLNKRVREVTTNLTGIYERVIDSIYNNLVSVIDSISKLHSDIVNRLTANIAAIETRLPISIIPVPIARPIIGDGIPSDSQGTGFRTITPAIQPLLIGNILPPDIPQKPPIQTIGPCGEIAGWTWIPPGEGPENMFFKRAYNLYGFYAHPTCFTSGINIKVPQPRPPTSGWAYFADCVTDAWGEKQCPPVTPTTPLPPIPRPPLPPSNGETYPPNECQALCPAPIVNVTIENKCKDKEPDPEECKINNDANEAEWLLTVCGMDKYEQYLETLGVPTGVLKDTINVYPTMFQTYREKNVTVLGTWGKP